MLWASTSTLYFQFFFVHNTTFSNIMATSFSDGRSQSITERTTDHGQATGNLYHLWLRVECTFFVIYKTKHEPTGLYELLGNPTTQLTEPTGPAICISNIVLYSIP